ncbi:hypothetical protein GO001_03960 [Streptomyces sp. NRRL B-1677]|uniref:Uncharacterized protein n=1 Tax=Streptomyces klenkii TaxID=1420899 RepID=A0A3B0BCV0_9ACTN|nr:MULTISPECIES: hypothetical protein [Streptomyces]MBF6044377.1 hypothetical protein [Streptomyces sp. NRRL B-1677]RKN70211.1 hypothetical protein D7231_20185 [Streptomyces klenkii]
MTDPNLAADAAALGNIAKGINEAIGELKSLGTPGEAAVGRGFDELALSGVELGHEGLAGAFKTFCNRWDWGVRALVQDGSQFAERVGLAAGYYHEQDVYIRDSFKVGVNAAMGNPHLLEEDVEKKSMREILADNPINDFRNPDYSAESFRKAGENSSQVWANTLRDASTGAANGFGKGPLGRQGTDAANKLADKLDGGRTPQSGGEPGAGG